MTYKQTTSVPNFVFDKFLIHLSESELKILLVIIRQTSGWVNWRTGQRKERDRISGSQFQLKTGYSRRSITTAIQSLLNKHLIKVTDQKGNDLSMSLQRKGRYYLFYSLNQPVQNHVPASAKDCTKPAQSVAHNKINYQKANPTKLGRGFSGHVSQLTERMKLIYRPEQQKEERSNNNLRYHEKNLPQR